MCNPNRLPSIGLAPVVAEGVQQLAEKERVAGAAFVELRDEIGGQRCRSTSVGHFGHLVGGEADEPLTAGAFNTAMLPGRARLRPVFASDIGHWDVPDMREVLPEAWELVEDGHIGEAEFRAFTCDNVASLLTGTNPRFFEGTSVEGYVAESAG